MITHLVFDGIAESSLGVGIDIVGAARRLIDEGLADAPAAKGLLRQRVVSLDGRAVRSGARRSIAVDGAFSPRGMGTAGVLVMPGLFSATQSSIGRWLAQGDGQRLADAVGQAAARGARVAVSCGATFVAAASGVLDGQRATTTWWLAPAFARLFPAVTLDADRMVVEAGRVLTAGSAFAHADLMLAVIARIASPTLAHLVARYLALDERASQSRYMVMEHLRVSDPALLKVEQFITRHLGRQITLAELARAAAVSPRTLARRVHAGLGMTPVELVRRMRVSQAARLLESGHASVEDVAARVGYADSAAFRRVFRRHAGESPRGRRNRVADSGDAG